MRITLAPLLALLLAHPSLAAADPAVSVRSDFPGGNVLVIKNDGDPIQLAPDLRGGRPWFYWHFEAAPTRPGRVTFTFADPPMIGVRGPAVSEDGGLTWRWLGTQDVTYAPPAKSGDDKAARRDAFAYDFAAPLKPVRFAVAIPYVQADLDRFLASVKTNPLLTRGTLTKTARGRDVQLLQIGQPGPGVRAVLLTARHHACESMASYVLEGFLREAIADSPVAEEFRRRYVVYAVPFVDADGVEAGDQGKNRLPHDHNRDYGKSPIYAEVKAIQTLAAEKKVELALDVHCPFLKGDVHEAFYFDGLAEPRIHDNVNELIAWLREERPPAAMAPMNFLKRPLGARVDAGLPFSHYFAHRDGVVMAATLEVPYAQAAFDFDADMARAYGASLLRAWTRTEFVAEAGRPRGATSTEALLKLRADFFRLYRSKPDEAERLIHDHAGPGRPAVIRAESQAMLAQLRTHQRRYADAREIAAALRANSNATTNRHAAAATQLLMLATTDPKAAPADVEAAVKAVAEFPYNAANNRARAYDLAAGYYDGRGETAVALAHAKRQLSEADRHEKGRVLNRIAGLHDKLGDPAAALAARRDAVAVLRPQLEPTVPVGQFAALMAGELFDALTRIPDATPAERRAAADMVLNHKAAPADLKARVQRAMEKP